MTPVGSTGQPKTRWGLLQPLKRFLRRPIVIVVEVLLLTLACALGAALPQAGRSTAQEVARLRSHGAFLSALVDGLALDHLFTSPGFLIALAFATASLSIVLVEQFRRLAAQWRLEPTEGAFRSAPFRKEFSRPATGASTVVRSSGRLNLAGSPLFHLGLLCVILAGALQALFSVSAVVDLYEGEVLPPAVEAWGAQRPGPLGTPFVLETPLRLVSVESTSYGSGDLQTLHLRLAEMTADGDRMREMGINQDLPVPRGRLYADAQHGPAALVEWSLPAGPAIRTAALLERKETSAFGTYAQGPGPLRARIRVPMPGDGSRPGWAEVRILSGPSVLAEGPLRPGESLPLPGGGSIKLHGLPYWARIHGSYDPAIGLAYLGFTLALAGACLTYGITRVDELVAITPEGESERVVVALRPHRFAPLYQERFERMVRNHGGEV